MIFPSHVINLHLDDDEVEEVAEVLVGEIIEDVEELSVASMC